MDFDPTFALLAKFMSGLAPTTITEDEITAVARYLGVVLPHVSSDDRVEMLSKEVDFQNGFLSYNLEQDSIYRSDEYRRSMFVREIVANNRINRQRRIDGRGNDDPTR